MHSKRLLSPLLILASLVVVPAATWADAEANEAPLTLEAAIEIALEENPALHASDARTAAAEARVDAARAGRLPRVEAEASVQETNNPTLVFSNLLGQAAFTEANFAIDRLNEPDALTNWRGRVTVEQPIWTGGRLGAGIAAAEAGRDATAAQGDAARQQIVHGVVEAWTGALVARRAVDVADATLETAEANAEMVRDLREGGLVVESDVLQAEVRLAEVREARIRAEADAAIADAGLARALGRPLGERFALPADLPPEALDPESEESIEALVEEARDHRPELAAADLARRAAERLADLERAERRPSVGVGAFAEANAEDFFGADGDNWGVTVALTVPVYDPRRGATIAEKAAGVDEAAARLASLEDAVEFEVHRAFHDLRAARQRLEVASSSVTSAERGLEIVRDRYQNGLGLLPELLDAESALARARLRHLAAERDLRLARSGLDLAVGRLGSPTSKDESP